MVRALTASDDPAARALAHAAYDGTRNLARALELIALAVSGEDPECVGVVSTTDAVVDALLLHGPIAGALAVEKLHLLVGREAASSAALLDAFCREAGWRMIVCEVTADTRHATTVSVLAARGFTGEGSVATYFDDDTDLLIFVLRRDAGEG